MAFTIRFRRGTAAQASASSRVLALGEPALETDTGRLRIGDGVTATQNLDYYPSATEQFASIDQVAGGNVGDRDTDLGDALATAFVPLSGLKVPLDIWPDYTGPATYAAWISEIDAALAGAATKSTIGTASDGTTSIYRYTFGPATAPHILLVGGTHGDEVASAMGCWRWFERFIGSTNEVMVALRQRLRVSWIPYLNASQYRGTRYNSNGIDINRNYPFNWSIANDSRPKGSAMMTEPENLAIKALLDSTDIAAVIDCHTNETTANHLGTGPSAPYLHMNQTVNPAALAVFKTLYPVNGGVPLTTWDYSVDWLPLLSRWAAKHLRWNLGRVNAATALLEIQRGLLGSAAPSNAIPFVTQAANRVQCGYITTWIIEWLEHGQQDGERVAPLVTGRINQPTQDTAVNVSAGGLHLPNGASSGSPVSFEATAGLDYIVVNVRGPGHVTINYDVAVTNSGASDAFIETQIGFGPMTPTGTAPKKTGGMVQSFKIPAGETRIINRSLRDEVTPSTFINGDATAYYVQLFIRALNTGVSADLAAAYRAGSVTATFTPAVNGFPPPAPTRS